MTGGVVYGGWEFVYAAYGITFAALSLYGARVVLKLRTLERRSARDPGSTSAGDRS